MTESSGLLVGLIEPHPAPVTWPSAPAVGHRRPSERISHSDTAGPPGHGGDSIDDHHDYGRSGDTWGTSPECRDDLRPGLPRRELVAPSPGMPSRPGREASPPEGRAVDPTRAAYRHDGRAANRLAAHPRGSESRAVGCCGYRRGNARHPAGPSANPFHRYKESCCCCCCCAAATAELRSRRPYRRRTSRAVEVFPLPLLPRMITRVGKHGELRLDVATSTSGPKPIGSVGPEGPRPGGAGAAGRTRHPSAE